MNEIEKKAQAEAKKMLWYISLGIAFSFSILKGNLNFGGIVVFTLFFGVVFWIPINIFFYNSIYKSNLKEKTEEYQQELMEREEQDYQKYSNRELEHLRQKLNIEFEHYLKIAMLNAHNDQQKIRMIQKMEREFEQTKKDDLASLDAQIQRMKKGL